MTAEPTSPPAGPSANLEVTSPAAGAQWAAVKVSARWARVVAWRALCMSPAVLWALVWRSPQGLVKLVGVLARYLYDFDSAHVRHHHARAIETDDYVRAHGVRKANLKARWMVAGTAGALVLAPALAWTFPGLLAVIAAVLLFIWIVKLIPGRGFQEVAIAAAAAGITWWSLPGLLEQLPRPTWWQLAAAGAAVVLALGWYGRPAAEAAAAKSALVSGLPEPLRAPVVTASLCELGNAKMREPAQIGLLMDPARAGQGYQVDLELPRGVPAAFVVGKREEFASALRREIGCVWPSVGVKHPGHLQLFVSDQPMALQSQDEWPLLHAGKVDLFESAPEFTDQRGEWVPLRLAYANMVIGALPRMGKTFLLRQLLLTAGLDPRAKVYALDGKGTGDLAPCALYAHFYARGARSDRPEQIDRVRGAVRELRAELGRRSDVIDGLTPEECPESKVTSALANRRELGLEPIVVGIDETQAYFEYGDDGNKLHKAIRLELASGITELVKLGPALGIWVFLATQQVNKDTIPTSISNNAAIRACLKIFGQDPNDRILGTGAYKNGIDATQFSQDDVGILYLRADGARPRIVRTVAGLDAVASTKVAARARAYREDDGRLTGDAAGEAATAEAFQVDLLEDVREVMDADGGRNASLTTLREALELLRPKLYGHLDNDALGGLLRGAGVEPRAVHCAAEGRTMKGLKRGWLDVAEPDDDADESA